MKLYDAKLSGNCHKVRLLLSLIDLDYEIRPVDLSKGEQKEDWFLSLNPRGQVPVLEDGDTVIWDSQAILVYLARAYDDGVWLPEDPRLMGEVQEWLTVAALDIHTGVAQARRLVGFGYDGDLQEARERGRETLRMLEDRLDERSWLVSDHPTIADVACYPYVERAGEGDLSLSSCPAVRAWIERMEELPGFVPMPELEG